jgi:hypothetical protein
MKTFHRDSLYTVNLSSTNSKSNGKETRYNRDSIPDRGKNFSAPSRPHKLTGTPSLLVYMEESFPVWGLKLTNYVHLILFWGRSQWPRGLRHELSSLALTLGSLVQIPIKACISVCVYSVICVTLRR